MASTKRKAKASRDAKPGMSRMLSAKNYDDDGADDDVTLAKESALKELKKWKKKDVEMWINEEFGSSKTIIRKIAPHFKDGATLEKLKGKDLKNFLENKCKIYSSPQRRMIAEGIAKLKKGMVDKYLVKLLAKRAEAEEEALKAEQVEIQKLMDGIAELEKKLTGADLSDRPATDGRLKTWQNWKALLDQWDFTFENAPDVITVAGSGRTDFEFNQAYNKAGLYEERACYVSADKAIALRFESDKPATAGWVLRIIKTRSLEFFCNDVMAATADLATAKWQTWERDSWRTKPNISCAAS